MPESRPAPLAQVQAWDFQAARVRRGALAGRPHEGRVAGTGIRPRAPYGRCGAALAGLISVFRQAGTVRGAARICYAALAPQGAQRFYQ